MTTPAAEALYKAQHVHAMEGKGWAVYNPDNLEVLPIIYGFNNGGSRGWYSAVLVAADGEGLGSHICSDEAYMYHDLRILEGTRPDRHETFRRHYPHGYRMEFVTMEVVKAKSNLGFEEAIRLNAIKYEEAKARGDIKVVQGETA